jgi:hypothetical protein
MCAAGLAWSQDGGVDRRTWLKTMQLQIRKRSALRVLNLVTFSPIAATTWGVDLGRDTPDQRASILCSSHRASP